ncbi:PIN domain-containing protein [Candidatus Mycobacterium methanotrophicum]|uniref:PIN domain-containing protein n=1 Tax=Candidatus Mycobacterium methanotrophicum TaxID=2943498 RepID=A0ABY4QND8_9MYCO|nr:PIN domain-containing protein [Candidatus Mycobacterium methanotrophicum]UQX12389.1 PIN domain-containing protein [Candidatus Mycobacterium methanotrophicum]
MPTFAGSLDANVVLRLLLNDVPQQHTAAIALLESGDAPFVVSDVAVIEVVFVLCRHYQFSRDAAAEAIEGLMSLPQIDGNRAVFNRALPLFAQRRKLSFEDCCLATYAEVSKAQPLWTFDTKLAGQAISARLVPQTAQ